ncbi:hypothetical protein [Pinirhizobacter soli]|uniref:hypothetical protein n=1 Tax=Pinirhizobacter soli TaxID=2786953 RepID=UPI00202A23DD|nr:hypothetical protein [Pinirhizobacter soli]
MAYLTVVDNVSAMLALSHANVASGVQTMGYYSPGDGGDGVYRMDLSDTTSPSDGVLVQVATDGTRYKLEPTNGVVNVRQGGARGNSNGTPGNGADDTARIQATVTAVGHGAMYVPAGIYRTTSVINVGAATKIYGDGYTVNRTGNQTAPNTIGSGSWFYFDHTGIGFYLTTTFAGGLFRGIATLRNQPLNLVAGWTPTANDFDFLQNPSTPEWSWEDVMVLNPTKGFSLASRPRLQNVRGQPFQIGVYVDQSTDTGRFESIHFWPYWADNAAVENYQMHNLALYQFLRADNHTLLNCFGIFACWGVRISNGATGTVSKLRITSCDFDSVGYAIIVETAANAATLQIDNVSVQGDLNNQTFGFGLYVQSSNCRVMASVFNAVYCHQGVVRCEGSGNHIQIGNIEGIDWDVAAAGFAGIDIASGNVCSVGTYYLTTKYNATTNYLTGPIQVYLGSSATTGTTDANGIINIPHGLRARPSVAHIEPVSDSAMVTIVTATSNTTVSVKFRQSGNAAPYVNTPIAFQVSYHNTI